MTYGLLIYDFAPYYPSLFDSVAKDADFWPNNMVGWNTGKNQQSTPNWGRANVVPYLIAKSENWTQEMTDAINDSVAAWNAANPSNQTGAMQVIFTEEEAENGDIRAQLTARQLEIISQFE